jgi:hypothetical protein
MRPSVNGLISLSGCHGLDLGYTGNNGGYLFELMLLVIRMEDYFKMIVPAAKFFQCPIVKSFLIIKDKLLLIIPF